MEAAKNQLKDLREKIKNKSKECLKMTEEIKKKTSTLVEPTAEVKEKEKK